MMMFQQQSCYMFVVLCLYLLRWNHLFVGVEAARADRSSSPNSSSSSQSSLQQKVVDWLKSREGGFVNPKIEIRSFNPDDDNSNSDDSSDDDDVDNNYMMTGIFAKEKIAKGEILITVPWDSLFDSNRNGKVWDRKSYLSCGTIENLIDEFKKHSKHQENGENYAEGSEFGPYIEYLQNQPTGIIPSSWSENGQNLFLDVLGGEDVHSRQVLPPMNPTHYKTEWIETCEGSLNDLYIAMFVLSRADEDVLVPVYDFLNHKNDPNKGNMMSVERLDGIHHQTKAKRTIEADEQIYNSYNLCDGCGTRHDMFGTPEIFDDYGFVEGMPQRWYFFFDGIERLRLELDYKKDEDAENEIEDSSSSNSSSSNNNNKRIVASWNEELSLKRKNAIKQYFIHELRRLERLKRRVNTLGSIIQDKIPIKEWNLTWQYYDAIVDAMIYGYESLTEPRREDGGGDRRSKILEEICGGSFDIIGGHCSHYVNLTSDIEDDLPYELSTTTGRSNTPQNYELLEDVVSVIEEGDDSTTDTLTTTTKTTTTKKTTINFQQDQEDDEICLFENKELIICPTSRPYVYEPLVHLPAQFLSQVKRVMIIGGGNGMALHELLEQYPNDIERIVIIEEYQQIARKSSEYFHTKLYFDNDKVEWWFVDTIEDVSLFVEGQIDLFDLIILDYIIEIQNVDNTMQSIACLLDDNGIFATFANEMRHIRRAFKYSVQFFPFDYPVVGKYGLLVLASHTVDFHHIELFDHEVEVYMYRKLKTTREFFYMTQNFYWNSHPVGTPRYRICKPTLNGYEITEILEMDQIRKPKILTTLHDSLSRNGYEIKSTSSGSTTLFALVLDEGYIIVSTGVPAEDASGYVGLDVHLWNSRYADMIQLRRLLIDALEAKSLSSFRLLKSHRESNKERPDIQSSSTTTRNTTIQEMTQSQQWLTSKIFALPYLEIEKEAVGVVCGGKEQECQSYNAAADISATGSVIRFWMCPELDDGADKLVGISSSAMEDCERDMMVQFDKATRTKKINVLVLDMSAGILMLKVVDSLLSSTTNRKKWLGTEYVVLALSFGEEANSSRRAFLDRIRQYIYMYPTARVELVIEREDSAIELGVVTSANDNAFGALVALQKGLHSFFSTAYNQSSTPIVNITSVVGGVIPNEDFAGYDPQLQVDPTLLYPNGEDDEEGEGTNGSSERIRRYQTFARLQLSSTDQNIPRAFSYIEEVLEVLRHRMSDLTGVKQHKQIQSETGRTTLIRTSVEGITIISHDGSLGVVTINHHGPNASDPFIEMFLAVCKESEGIDVLSVDYHPRGLDVWTTSINTCHLNGISEPSCVATY